jgi:hypothetical protein
LTDCKGFEANFSPTLKNKNRRLKNARVAHGNKKRTVIPHEKGLVNRMDNPLSKFA